MRQRASWLLKGVAAILVAILATACTVQISPPEPGASGAHRASTSGVTTTVTSGSACSICAKLRSDFPILAALTFYELEGLLEEYGPDVETLLWAAGLLLGD